jgi:hypothetical protein
MQTLIEINEMAVREIQDGGGGHLGVIGVSK